MRIDATQFPLVRIHLKALGSEPAAAGFAAFETLLARQEEFVLLNDEGVDRSGHERSPEEMKQTSLWMKRHKSDLHTFVKAAIFIEPSTAMRLATYSFATVYEKFWGYPMHMVGTEEDALALAKQLLEDEPTDMFLELL